jgi:hypothetical protein
LLLQFLAPVVASLTASPSQHCFIPSVAHFSRLTRTCLEEEEGRAKAKLLCDGDEARGYSHRSAQCMIYHYPPFFFLSLSRANLRLLFTILRIGSGGSCGFDSPNSPSRTEPRIALISKHAERVPTHSYHP